MYCLNRNRRRLLKSIFFFLFFFLGQIGLEKNERNQTKTLIVNYHFLESQES